MAEEELSQKDPPFANVTQPAVHGMPQLRVYLVPQCPEHWYRICPMRRRELSLGGLNGVTFVWQREEYRSNLLDFRRYDREIYRAGSFPASTATFMSINPYVGLYRQLGGSYRYANEKIQRGGRAVTQTQVVRPGNYCNRIGIRVCCGLARN